MVDCRSIDEPESLPPAGSAREEEGGEDPEGNRWTEGLQSRLRRRISAAMIQRTARSTLADRATVLKGLEENDADLNA